MQVGSKSLEDLPKGYHKMRYADDELRIWRTNAGSNMAAVRMEN